MSRDGPVSCYLVCWCLRLLCAGLCQAQLKHAHSDSKTDMEKRSYLQPHQTASLRPPRPHSKSLPHHIIPNAQLGLLFQNSLFASGAVTFASNVTCTLPAFARKTPSELTYASTLYHTLAIAAHVVLHEVHEASKRRRFCGRKCITRTKASVASLPTTKVATECMPDTIVTISLHSQEMPTCPHQFHEWMVHRTAAIPEQ